MLDCGSAIFKRYVEPFFGGGAVLFSLFNCTPFLRWVGGKRKIANDVVSALGTSKFDYHLANDLNEDLISAYKEVSTSQFEVTDWLRRQPRTAEHFYTIRDNKIGLSKGKRAIYLNLFGHGGLWRVNSDGIYNVPPQKDRLENLNLDRICEQIEKASVVLSSVVLQNRNALEVINDCIYGDFVYCDPPYLPDSTSQFVNYTAKEQSALEFHNQLADVIISASMRGVKLVLSNSPSAVSIYRKKLQHVPNVRYDLQIKSSSRSIGVGKGALAKQDEVLLKIYSTDFHKED
jgi:DNA adenine methylase